MNYFSLCSSKFFWLKESVQHPALNHCWEQAERIEKSSLVEIQQLQQEKIQKLLIHAVRTVPYYRDWFARKGCSLDGLSISDFPILTKADFRGRVESFISDTCSKRKLFFSRTSGSTGEPFGFYKTKASFDYTYATLWRGLARYEIHPGDKRVLIKGIDEVPQQTYAKRICRAIYGKLNRCIVVDAHFLGVSEDHVLTEIQRVMKYGPVYFHGYASSIYLLAKTIEERQINLGDLKLKAIVTESEKCHDFQRKCMERVFRCRVIENYGCVEFGMIAQPAVDGTLCLNEDHVFVETTDSGEAVLTNLDEYGFPLIRFKNGDLLSIGPPHNMLPYRTVIGLDGRVAEAIKLPGGGQLQGYIVMYPISKHMGWIKAYQIHQITMDLLVLRFVVDRPLPDEIRLQILREMQEIVGAAVNVEIEIVDSIPLSKSGKRTFVRTDIKNGDEL